MELAQIRDSIKQFLESKRPQEITEQNRWILKEIDFLTKTFDVSDEVLEKTLKGLRKESVKEVLELIEERFAPQTFANDLINYASNDRKVIGEDKTQRAMHFHVRAKGLDFVKLLKNPNFPELLREGLLDMAYAVEHDPSVENITAISPAFSYLTMPQFANNPKYAQQIKKAQQVFEEFGFSPPRYSHKEDDGEIEDQDVADISVFDNKRVGYIESNPEEFLELAKNMPAYHELKDKKVQESKTNKVRQLSSLLTEEQKHDLIIRYGTKATHLSIDEKLQILESLDLTKTQQQNEQPKEIEL